MFGRQTQFQKSVGRRLVGLAVLVSVCASFFPLPVPSFTPNEKDASEPYPCQSRPCGCRSAEQCWKKCCCFTNAEKVAWAKENGVTPPTYVVEAANAESNAKIAVVAKPDPKQCSHCSTATSCEKSNSCSQSRSRPACCSGSDSDSNTCHQKTDSPADDNTHYVIGFEMMKCRGQGLYWNSLPWAVMPVECVPEFRPTPVNWDRPQSIIAASIVTEPPEPPPRLA